VARRIYWEGREAIRELVKFAKECLEIGGLPMMRTEYAGMPFSTTVDTTKMRGVMALCYGRARYLPSVTVFAPEAEDEWRELVEDFTRYAGDYRMLLYRYGGLVSDEEVERELERRLGRELLERLRTAPLMPVR